MEPTVLSSSGKPSESNIRALRLFLDSTHTSCERSFHALLKDNPPLVGVLGKLSSAYCFSEFVSELPLIKPDQYDEPIVADRRQRDRADIVAARPSPFLLPDGRPVLSAHVIELKGAGLRVAGRRAGSRLSDDAMHAVIQAKEYRRWLTEIPQNKDVLKKFGWTVRKPSLFMVMGRNAEFTDNPGQMDELKGELLSDGVLWCTVDELLEIASQEHGRSIALPFESSVQLAPQQADDAQARHVLINTPASLGHWAQWAGERTSLRSGRLFSISSPPSFANYREYESYLERDFCGVCAYCRVVLNELPSADFAVGHYLPKSRYPHLEQDYKNLFLSCHRCITTKGSKTLPLDPRYILDEHFTEVHGIWHPKDREAEALVNLLHLNSEQRVYHRHMMEEFDSRMAELRWLSLYNRS